MDRFVFALAILAKTIVAENSNEEFDACAFTSPALQLTKLLNSGGDGKKSKTNIILAHSINKVFQELVEDWLEEESDPEDIFEEGLQTEIFSTLPNDTETICTMARSLIAQMEGTCHYDEYISAYVNVAANFMHGVSNGKESTSPVNILECTYVADEEDSDGSNGNGGRGSIIKFAKSGGVTFEELHGKYLTKETIEEFRETSVLFVKAGGQLQFA